MYSHPGEYVTDFCIVRREGVYHLFHIRGERWTWPLGYKELDLGHAVSRDLRVWEPLAPVVPAGPVGAWDECGVWAPDVIEAGGLYYLYYTGSDVRNNQAIGLATSPDLMTWTKHAANPVVTPGPWSDRAMGRDVAGRDGMVFHDAASGRYLMYYTATMADGRACLALAESHDLVAWRDLGPTLVEEDRSYNRLESPYLVAHGGRYYLFYSAKGGPKSKGYAAEAFDHFDIVYVVSDDPAGGWVKPANHELLAGWMCASEHPTFDGVTYMLYVVQEEMEGVWGASVLSDPKRVEWMADGTVRVREHVPGNVTRRPLFKGIKLATEGTENTADTENNEELTAKNAKGAKKSNKEGMGGGAAEAGLEAGWVEHGGAWQVDEDGRVRAPGMGEAWLVNPLWGRDGVIRGGGAHGRDGVAGGAGEPVGAGGVPDRAGCGAAGGGLLPACAGAARGGGAGTGGGAGGGGMAQAEGGRAGEVF